MPNTIQIAAFVLGAVLLLLALVGGQFKIFGAEIQGMVGPWTRVIASMLGVAFVAVGILSSPTTEKKRERAVATGQCETES